MDHWAKAIIANKVALDKTELWNNVTLSSMARLSSLSVIIQLKNHSSVYRPVPYLSYSQHLSYYPFFKTPFKDERSYYKPPFSLFSKTHV